MKIFFLLTLFLSLPVYGQYYPRGTSLNDNYLPNLDQPDKWIVDVDGMFDFQKEKLSNSEQSYQTTRSNFNLFYGGQNFRGGVQVLHDFSRDVKDLSLGLGMTFNRPLFFEAGIGYLSRIRNSTSTEGWSYNIKVGYYYSWIMRLQFRVRVRLSLVFDQKILHDNNNPSVTNFYPLIGFEFET